MPYVEVIKSAHNGESHIPMLALEWSMVNPVGSSENKHWQKKWLQIKKDAVLSPLQRSFIIGSLLGDGTMRTGVKAANANFKVEHGLKQKEYVFWKYEILRDWVYTEPKVSMRNDSNGIPYEKSWWFRTMRHPLLTEIYDHFYTRDGYRVGRKIIPEDIAEYIDPFALAVWIMDDGSYSKGNIDISTYSFNLPEIKLLQRMMEKNFNVQMRHHSDRDKGYRMYCNNAETQKIISTIYPYIVPSMMYKIGFHYPVTTGFEAQMKCGDEDSGECDVPL